ncbi:protease modulator HflC [Bradymonadaceae bacterium TMQ3]|uniref:Protein HflC n=1 Tax=Lujinxingia sediminis TaxID=2480984 RepID=A0ABY0CW39_9DELT|nr:protease modulator HflC [Lujinxingia sediminis]RDV40060.1 protease modulator HflC [Bradymonadaceae bacterium TMQ3]RVU47893.1 protease modulator HflC [Lujinxingia sediminis]TXC77195.1 protease modulator HflC [Bradymonadales bacterium TMQ1]
MSWKSSFMIAGAIIALILLSSATVVVDENEQIVITQFGKPVGEALTEPGLYYKTPFIQSEHRFEKRFLEWNGNRNQIPTRDKRFVWVDTYARWRIVDPLRFYQRVRDERGAKSRLDDIIDGATRDAVANHDLIELVRSTNRVPLVDEDLQQDDGEDLAVGLTPIVHGRSKIMADILEQSALLAADLGVEVLDVRVKRINYNEDVQNRVYERMVAERFRIAEKYRSQGQGEAASISGERDRELKRIESEAFRKAEEIRGRADAEAAAIYAEAYAVDPEFYRFLRTMESYEDVIGSDSVLMLSTESEFLEYLKSSQ